MKDFGSEFKHHRLSYLKTQLDEAARRRRELVILLFTVVPISPVVLGWPISTLALMKAPAMSATLRPLLQGYAIMFALLAASLLWVHMLRDAIGGSRFNDYAATLPVPAFIHNRVDLLTICLANFPLWVMVAVSLVTGPYAHLSTGELWLFLLRIAAIIAFILLAQLRFLRGHKGIVTVLALIVSTSLIFGSLLTAQSHMALVAVALLALTVSLCASCLPSVGTFRIAKAAA